jgi:hypothetical protein
MSVSKQTNPKRLREEEMVVVVAMMSGAGVVTPRASLTFRCRTHDLCWRRTVILHLNSRKHEVVNLRVQSKCTFEERKKTKPTSSIAEISFFR